MLAAGQELASEAHTDWRRGLPRKELYLRNKALEFDSPRFRHFKHLT